MSDRPRKDRFVEPGHFYSPVTDRDEAKAYLESEHYRRQVAHADSLIDYPVMRQFWEDFAPRMIDFPFERRDGFRYFGRNNQFTYFDGTILSGILAVLDPKRIVEIGAGYSSAAMFDTIDRMTNPRLERFVTIDPDLSRIRQLDPPPMAEMLDRPVQEVPSDLFTSLEAGDLLFIDSSHVLKTGSDVHFEYLHILPALSPGVWVHIHDIQHPFEYPPHWIVAENRSWNEAYLVDAMLTHGRAFRIEFFNDAFVKREAAILRKPGDMFDRMESTRHRAFHRVCGSLWLRKL